MNTRNGQKRSIQTHEFYQKFRGISFLVLFQLSESSTKDHMDKWTELEEKCARMIAHTKELETRSGKQPFYITKPLCHCACSESCFYSSLDTKLGQRVDVMIAQAYRIYVFVIAGSEFPLTRAVFSYIEL